MPEPENYDFTETLSDLDAGVFINKVSRAVRDCAMNTVEHNKRAKVVIELSMERVGDSNQIKMEHALKYEKPTKRGKSIEHDKTSTPLYVNRGGRCSIIPERPEDYQLFQD